MAITFAYTQATNTVVQTEGTSGTPATFADFVTADRAGALTLLDAGVIDADPDTFSLTTQPRPCEKGVLKLTITASADRVGATMGIVGKDYDGDAVSELAIDISGAASTPVVTTMKFNTVDASGVTVDGMTNDDTVTITQGQWGVIWDHGFKQYTISCHLDVGDGSTATYFGDSLVSIVFEDVYLLDVTAAATYRQGVKNSATSGAMGGLLAWEHNSGAVMSTDITFTGIVYLYGVTVTDLSATGKWNNPQFIASHADSEIIGCSFYNIDKLNVKNTGNVTGCIFNSCHGGLYSDQGSAAPVILDTSNQYSSYGLYLNQNSAPITVIGYTAKNSSTTDILFGGGNSDITVIDSVYTTIGGPSWGTGRCYIKYTCNITVADKDGTLLDGVEVLCEDTNDATEWTTTTGDTDTGKIDEQTVTYKDRYANAQEDTLSPHKFTISKAGYETLILENVTVDAPIKWHLELQDPVSGTKRNYIFLEEK